MPPGMLKNSEKEKYEISKGQKEATSSRSQVRDQRLNDEASENNRIKTEWFPMTAAKSSAASSRRKWRWIFVVMPEDSRSHLQRRQIYTLVFQDH